MTPGQAVVGLGVALAALTAISLASPFLELTQGFGGIINLVIIAIGLRQAWRLTRPDEAPITGPYTP